VAVVAEPSDAVVVVSAVVGDVQLRTDRLAVAFELGPFAVLVFPRLGRRAGAVVGVPPLDLPQRRVGLVDHHRHLRKPSARSTGRTALKQQKETFARRQRHTRWSRAKATMASLPA